MRFVLFVLVAFATACTKPNPNTCCTTEAQCAALGASELRPCDVGQACGTDFQCVAAECATSAECPSDRPICQNELCVGACTSNDDCADVAGRSQCASDGVCVGCTDSSQCSGTTAICDAEDRTCRGCDRDDECGSGVCIEAEGTCADESTLLFVVSGGGVDRGTCTRAAPCARLSFALGHVSATRNIVRVVGGELSESTTIAITSPVIIDGNGTRFRRPSMAPTFHVEIGSLVLGGVQLNNTGTPYGTAITMTAGRTVTLNNVELDNVGIDGTSGSFYGTRLTTDGARISCMDGVAELRDSDFKDTRVSFQNCQVAVARNRFDVAGDATISGVNGAISVTNNAFIVPSEFTDLINIGTVSSNSLFAFNTIVNTSGVVDSAVAISCSGPLRITSSVIAYGSTNPLSGCVADHSLFDTSSGSDADGNRVGDRASFFIDLAALDLRPSANSLALGIGAPGLVATDLTGRARPDPLGSNPDAGAYEAP